MLRKEANVPTVTLRDAKRSYVNDFGGCPSCGNKVQGKFRAVRTGKGNSFKITCQACHTVGALNVLHARQ